MTAGPHNERYVAASVRPWRIANTAADSGTRETAARELADALELWIADLCAAEERWSLTGRWYDGLILSECTLDPPEQLLRVRGHIWTIDQARCHFSAWVEVDGDRIVAFDVRLGRAERALSRRDRAETEWDFRFRRSP